MKLNVRCRSGLRIDFEGSIDELERFDGFLAELARLERERLAPGERDVDHSPDRSDDPAPPSPPCVPAPAAEPDASSAPEQVADTATPATPSARPTAPRAGGRGAVAGTRNAETTLDAIGRLAVCSKRELMAETGLAGSTMTNVLRRLLDEGLIVATGQTTARRFKLADEDTPEPAPEPEPDPHEDAGQDDERLAAGIWSGSGAVVSELEQRVVELVHRHGPVHPDWIADQVVKNRRETAATMRDLERRGHITVDGGWYDIPGRQEAQAA